MSLRKESCISLSKILVLFLMSCSVSTGALYPRESESREIRSLDGVWNFRLAPRDDPDLGFRDMWYSQPLEMTGSVIPIAVPSSYNDATQDKTIRDHVGWAWYDRKFYVPLRWEDDFQRVMLAVGSVHYYAMVYVNGILVTSHEGGHLPFEAQLNDFLNFEAENLITIAVNNTLNPVTIPQGKIYYPADMTKYPEGYFVQQYSFDFFNYAGIHRSVLLYTTPSTYVKDVEIYTDVQGATGIILYNITHETNSSSSSNATLCAIKLLSQNGSHLDTVFGCSGNFSIQNARLWWPYLMEEEAGYMYALKISVTGSNGTSDIYTLKVGIRTLAWNSTTFTINNKPIYFLGCGKHEDSDIRGKGLDLPLMIKDFSLLKWLGANSFRTSHYPYADEIMDMADREGIMIIDEAPSVNLEGFNDTLLAKHLSVMEELVTRDKSHPSVVMWSIANEPVSDQAPAANYFSTVVDWVKSLDSTRPVSAAISKALLSDLAAESLDIIMINRYYGWYSDTGHTELIEMQTINEVLAWNTVHDKPIIMSEYGAGAIAGIHSDPDSAWSEEYQVQLMLQNFKAFDDLRNRGFFIGEMIWNFADFATAQG